MVGNGLLKVVRVITEYIERKDAKCSVALMMTGESDDEPLDWPTSKYSRLIFSF